MMMSWLALQGLLLLTIAAASPATVGATDDPTVLIEVNGAPITSDRIDEMIMQSHRQVDMAESDESLMIRLLEKAINDELILQEAAAMGIHEDPNVVEEAEKAAVEAAIREFAVSSHDPPSEVTDAEVEEVFQKNYHRIQLRSISMRTREEIDAIRESVQAGVNMDALARESSLDTKAHAGGLMNFVYAADLEAKYRGASDGLAVGEVSEPFRNNEAWTIVRVEQRAPVDPAELPQFEGFIRAALLDSKRDVAWRGFIRGLRTETPVAVIPEVLDRLRADADIVFRGEFRDGPEVPALVIDDTHFVTEFGLRRAVSEVAMEMGDQDFEAVLEKSLNAESESLLLRTHAERSGAFESQAAIAAYDQKLEEVMLNVYLDETVVSKIFFERDEFDAFYEENKERFRASPRVRLSFLLLGTRDEADEAFARLEDGADFDYLRREMGSGGHGEDAAKWAPLNMFATELIEAVEGMSVGETSTVVPFNSRWMIVRLDGHRDGEVMPIEEVDMQIRQAMFQKQFKERLDAVLALLKERSDIVRYEDRIQRYFTAES